ncbi:MAG: hypothetical protein NWE83_12790 [Candidatus Bathyarchaeota archaeon]|jgi:hypothetical protein|nr:hypothetical protein [Candidatus Bathyarchaeota archaeon]
MLIGAVKVYHGGSPGLENNPSKPRTIRTTPKTYAAFTLLIYSGTKTQAIMVITPNIAKAVGYCNPMSIAITMDNKAQTAAKVTVTTAPF